MRLAYLCADFGIPIFGAKGAAIHVRELSEALYRQGVDVEIIAARMGGERPGGFHVPVRHLPLPPTEHALYDALRRDERGGGDVAREVRSMLYATVIRHAAEAEVRAFAPDAIYERYALYGTAGLRLSRELGIPLILEVNAPLVDEQTAHRGLAFGHAARTSELAILQGADVVVAVSAALRDWLIGASVAPEQIVVLPNGVDVERFSVEARARDATRARLGIDGGECLIGFVGTLKVWHGTATLLAAFAQLRAMAPDQPVRLLIVGDGPERVRLEALAASLGIADATVFTGAVPHAAIPSYVAAMDVAVAPYDRAEGFYFSPLKLFEYMAAGRPVVAADIGQLAECLRHGETALLYPPGDVAALAATLRTLVDQPVVGTRIGAAGRRWVERHRTWSGNARRVFELVEAAGAGSRDERGVA